MFLQDTDGLGRIEITTIPLPDHAHLLSASYTYSGKVLVFYRTDDDPEVKDYYHIAVVNDDGGAFRPIFAGLIPEHQTANGIRHMPFADNKRVLLGDYVLECSPDIDTCEQAELVRIRYPWLLPLDSRAYKHWSEIIIAPDNSHMCWTMLRSDLGAANLLGSLERRRDHYVITHPQVISSMAAFKADKSHPGYILPQVIRGGEVKQFVRGGTAISLVGSKEGYITDSVIQDLSSEGLTQITHTPGYDETTILSPDERLGIVMSTRGSPKTDPAIFGWLPRPYGHYAMQGLIMYLYMYAVAGVRSFRPGNIGPVLIDIERSMHEPGYRGVLLSDPEERWVYVSPMSWHPDGKRAMWLEMIRASETDSGDRQLRMRQVLLHDYRPAPAIAASQTPDDIPYGLKGLRGALSLWLPAKTVNEGKIAGQHSGFAQLCRAGAKGAQSRNGSTQLLYKNYSDDGKTFSNGYERAAYSFEAGCQYEADLEMAGERQGEMKLRVAFSAISTGQPPRLLFDPAEDGKPKSHGQVTYNGMTLRIEDLLE